MKNAIIILALMASSFANAQSYVGVGMSYNVLNGSIWQGQTDTSFDQQAMSEGMSASEKTNSKNTKDFGGRVFIGERMGNVAMEIGYTAHGTFKNNTANQYGVGVSTYYAHSFDMSVLFHKNNFFARMGIHSTKSEVNAHTWIGSRENISNLNAYSSGPLLGVGYQKGMFRAEYTKYFNVGLTDVVGKHSIDSFTLSVMKEF